MQASRNGATLIACQEAFVDIAYPDGKHKKGPLAGQIKWSAGFGVGGASEGQTIEFKDGFAQLLGALPEREGIVSRRLKRKVTQEQFDALVSYYYQHGNEPPTMEIFAKINDGLIDEAMDLLEAADRDGDGVRQPGLRKRRLRERKLFETGDYGDLSTIQVWHGNPHGRPPDVLYAVKPTDFVR